MVVKTQVKDRRFIYYLCAIVCMLVVYVMFGCEGSSNTRTTIQEASSGPAEINAKITAPKSGVTVLFIDGESNVEFASTVVGGQEPYGFTWEIVGPTSRNSASGQSPTLTFVEEGTFRITLTVRDSNGITDSDWIDITVLDATPPTTVAPTSTTVSTTSTSTTTTTTTTTTTI
jgi:PKD repeat protein